MTVDLDRLREAVEKLTPAPWQWDEPDNWQGLSARIRNDESANIAQVSVAGWKPLSRGIDQAAGIVALRNAAPSLLAELLAARGVVEACRNVGDCLDHAQNCCSDWCSGCQEALAAWATYRAALQAYDALNRSDAGKSEGAG